MLSFEITTLDEVAVHFDRAGLAALVRTLLKLADEQAHETRVVLDVAANGLRATTPFGEPAVRRVVLTRYADVI